MNKKSLSELLTENRMLRRFNVSQSITSVIIAIIKFGTVCFIFFMIYKSIYCLSGQYTHAKILINLLGSLKVNNSIAYILASFGIFYGFLERKLRQRTIKRLHNKVSEYETLFDRRRSSSRLSIEGNTHPRDII